MEKKRKEKKGHVSLPGVPRAQFKRGLQDDDGECWGVGSVSTDCSRPKRPSRGAGKGDPLPGPGECERLELWLPRISPRARKRTSLPWSFCSLRKALAAHSRTKRKLSETILSMKESQLRVGSRDLRNPQALATLCPLCGPRVQSKEYFPTSNSCLCCGHLGPGTAGLSRSRKLWEEKKK